MRVLSEETVESLLSLPSLLPVVADAFARQAAGAVERPSRPHYPVGFESGETPRGTALAMPAYIHGATHYATKLVSVHEDNRPRPTVQAQLSLVEADTGRPAAFLAARTVTNARTACIGGLAARTFAPAARTLGVLGAGTQARWQARAVAGVCDLETVRVHSPSDSRERCAADLDAELGARVVAVDSPRDCVVDADVVVTATTATDPVFDGADLSEGALVVAVGAYTPETRELDEVTLARADAVYADVPEEAAETGDLSGVDPGRVRPVADCFADGQTDRAALGLADRDVVVVKSVGTAVLDAATAQHVYEAAADADAGTVVSLDEFDGVDADAGTAHDGASDLE